jgi:hypothetical protein
VSSRSGGTPCPGDGQVRWRDGRARVAARPSECPHPPNRVTHTERSRRTRAQPDAVLRTCAGSRDRRGPGWCGGGQHDDPARGRGVQATTDWGRDAPGGAPAAPWGPAGPGTTGRDRHIYWGQSAGPSLPGGPVSPAWRIGQARGGPQPCPTTRPAAPTRGSVAPAVPTGAPRRIRRPLSRRPLESEDPPMPVHMLKGPPVPGGPFRGGRYRPMLARTFSTAASKRLRRSAADSS